ncbi:BlaI/MecI/CopY family transcriptional regulator [Nocardioides pocheonensis]|uniref:BlaI/MecI/CopY family transcriptional regulator n=1 Tax=Nocardioides pocheonensis TaxID=661485 RepID=A0A3N0GUS6_9ACTN|nr:BlaI/MecI/CopY family transcriptional regulator [Nocardioides pocheonensis]RNM15908.1 BlaI/MecI/CopY family transcriptional regulator [Nocardioides pocheonensis]
MPRQSRLGDLERSVMESLWDAGDAWRTVREVHDVLARDRDIAYTTVMTVLDRMARKDLVEREREGRAWRYRPSQSRGAMTAEVMRQALGEFAEEANARDRAAALVAFVGEATDADRQALRDALAALERRSRA